jgi:chitosanase
MTALKNWQMNAAHLIVEVFETGGFGGGNESYGRVTILPNDTGRLTYGKHQASLTSGGVYAIINRYVQAGGVVANVFVKYLKPLAERHKSVDSDAVLHKWMRIAGGDVTMQRIQDNFFYEQYSKPAIEWMTRLKLVHPLSYAVIYDSLIHGSFTARGWGGVKAMTDMRYGTAEQLGEKPWIINYLTTRNKWLAGHSNRLLRNTVYRMRELLRIANSGNWELELPIFIRGVEIHNHHVHTEYSFKNDRIRSKLRSYNYKTDPPDRNVFMKYPHMIGEDVYFLETSLFKLGYLDLKHVNAQFDHQDKFALISFQKAQRLSADGIAGTITFRKLDEVIRAQQIKDLKFV